MRDQIIRKTFGEKVIERDDTLRLITVILGPDKVNLHFTPMEYRILKVLLEHPKVSDADLAGHLRTIRGGEPSRVLLRHINNIRGQLRCADLDVLRIHQLGYMLNDLNLQSTQSAM